MNIIWVSWLKHILVTEYIHNDIHIQQKGLGMAMMRHGPLQYSIDDNAYTHTVTLLYLICNKWKLSWFYTFCNMFTIFSINM